MRGGNAVIFTVRETMADTLFNGLAALARKLNHAQSLHPRAHSGTGRLTQPAALHRLFPHYLQLAPYGAIKIDFSDTVFVFLSLS